MFSRGTLALVAIALLAVCANASSPDTTAFLELFVKRQPAPIAPPASASGAAPASASAAVSGSHESAVSGSEPRCGTQGGGKLCSQLGRAGECCSKWGLCGKKPYHCVSRLGCQSECNNDLDTQLHDSQDKGSNPAAVVPATEHHHSHHHTKVIIKSISPAVPLCEKCAAAGGAAANPLVSSLTPTSAHDLTLSAQAPVMGSGSAAVPTSSVPAVLSSFMSLSQPSAASAQVLSSSLAPPAGPTSSVVLSSIPSSSSVGSQSISIPVSSLSSIASALASVSGGSVSGGSSSVPPPPPAVSSIPPASAGSATLASLQTNSQLLSQSSNSGVAAMDMSNFKDQLGAIQQTYLNAVSQAANVVGAAHNHAAKVASGEITTPKRFSIMPDETPPTAGPPSFTTMAPKPVWAGGP